MRTTATLVATLMLSGMTCAYAQGGPSDKIGGAPDRGGGAAAQERSSPSDEGPSSRSSQGAEERSGPAADRSEGSSKSESAEKSGGKPSTKQSESDESKGNLQSSDEGAKGARRKAPEQGSDTKAADRNGETREGKSSNAAEKTNKASDEAKGEEKSNKSSIDDPTKATTAEKGSADHAKQVDLTGDKRTRVQTAFRSKGDVKQRTGVNINIAIGTRLPRDWDFVPIPLEVVEIVPEYRDYVFVYVDDEYVICDPDTYEVVTVIPADRSYAGGSSGRPSKCSRQLSLNADERELILESVSGGHEVDVSGLTVGWSVPKDIELLTFPDRVVSEASELGSCRYFVASDQIAIVDPDEDKVVLIIDKG